MQTYQSTPDYYRDFIEHGWLKNQAAKAHKYIERWKNEAGFWRYRYASKRLESKAKKARGPISAETVTQDIRNGKTTRVKDSYRSRKSSISKTRQKTHDTYLKRIRPMAAKNAKNRYSSRKSSISVARGNAHRAYGKKKLGVIKYNQTIKDRTTGRTPAGTIKTMYPLSNGIWYEDRTAPKIYKKKKK